MIEAYCMLFQVKKYILSLPFYPLNLVTVYLKKKIKFIIIKGTLTTQQTIQIRSNFAHKIKFGKNCSDNLLNLHAFRVMVIGGEKIMYKSNWVIIYCNFSPFLTDSYSHSMPVLHFHLKTIFILSHSYYWEVIIPNRYK